MADEMTITRLRHLLESYGAAPERWPADERDRAVALLARSPEARRLREAALRLDALLDAAPTGAASAALIERIVAAAPARGRRWRYVAAAAPLAAAAAVALWLVRTPEVPAPARTQLVVADLEEYESPLDELLVAPGLDLVGGEPALGCGDTELGCPTWDLPDASHSDSHTHTTRSTHA